MFRAGYISFSVYGFGYKIWELGEGPVLPHLSPEMGLLASCYQGRKRSSYNQVIEPFLRSKSKALFQTGRMFRNMPS